MDHAFGVSGVMRGTVLAILLAPPIFADPVTAQTVTSTTITDATNSARKARVDSAGQLATVTTPPVSNLASAGTFLNAGYTDVISPTTARIVVTQLTVAETRLNGTTNGSDLSIYFVQTSSSNGSCSGSVIRYLAFTALSSGDHADILSSPVPLAVGPIGGAPYCLAITSVVQNGAADGTTYYPGYTFVGYVASGTYTGTGTAPSAAQAAAAPATKKR